MCRSTYAQDVFIRFEGALENVVEEPYLHAFWAAGLSFGKGEVISQVPYDFYTPHLFMGEEVYFAIRAWTAGFDFYSFKNSVVFHVYPWSRSIEVEPQKDFRTDHHRKCDEFDMARSIRRVRHVVAGQDLGGFDKRELPVLGQVRTSELFFQVFQFHTLMLANSVGVIVNLCGEIMSGKFHEAAKSFLDPDKGIDYARFVDYYGVAFLNGAVEDKVSVRGVMRD